MVSVDLGRQAGCHLDRGALLWESDEQGALFSLPDLVGTDGWCRGLEITDLGV
jgi:hypothetical protein